MFEVVRSIKFCHAVSPLSLLSKSWSRCSRSFSVTVSCSPSNIVLPLEKFNEINKYYTGKRKNRNLESISEDRNLWHIPMPKAQVLVPFCLHLLQGHHELNSAKKDELPKPNPKQRASSCRKSFKGANWTKLTKVGSTIGHWLTQNFEIFSFTS